MFSKSTDPIGHKVILLDAVHSTNAYLAKIVSENHVKHGTIVQAKHQYAGKGQLSKQWHADENQNLTFSTLIKPHHFLARDQFNISVIVSLAVRATISEHISHCTIKWPNDIYIHDRKICGILIQNALMRDLIQHTIIGIGINVNQEIFDQNIPNPTSFKMELQQDFDLDTLLIQFCMVFEQYYQLIMKGELEQIWGEYEKHLFRYQKECSFRNKAGDLIQGKIMGVEVDGKLQLLEQNSLNSYSLHELSMLI